MATAVRCTQKKTDRCGWCLHQLSTERHRENNDDVESCNDAMFCSAACGRALTATQHTGSRVSSTDNSSEPVSAHWKRLLVFGGDLIRSELTGTSGILTNIECACPWCVRPKQRVVFFCAGCAKRLRHAFRVPSSVAEFGEINGVRFCSTACCSETQRTRTMHSLGDLDRLRYFITTRGPRFNQETPRTTARKRKRFTAVIENTTTTTNTNAPVGAQKSMRSGQGVL